VILNDKYYLDSIDEEDDSGSGDSSYKPSEFSILVEETQTMENARRLMEQEGHKRYARVNQRERQENEVSAELTEGLQDNVKSHPLLSQSQRFDGIDNNLNPEPPLNSEARREFDNQRREQEKEKQLRLGNMPKMSNRPKPQPS